MGNQELIYSAKKLGPQYLKRMVYVMLVPLVQTESTFVKFSELANDR